MEKILTIVKRINDPSPNMRLIIDYTSFTCSIMLAPYGKKLTEKETLDILFGRAKKINREIQTAIFNVNDLLLVTKRLLEVVTSEEE